MLNLKKFNEAQNFRSFQPQISCFTTRINTQLSERFSRSKAQKQNPQMFLQLIGVPISAIFFPSLQPGITFIAKNSSGASRSSNFGNVLANPTLVQSNFELSSTRASGVQTQCNKLSNTTRLASWRPGTLKTIQNTQICGKKLSL